MQTRILGLIFLCAGIGIGYWDYTMRHGGDSYYPMLTFIAPLFIGVAINFLIEAPQLPVNRPSIFGWICLLTGTAIGFWNACF